MSMVAHCSIKSGIVVCGISLRLQFHSLSFIAFNNVVNKSFAGLSNVACLFVKRLVPRRRYYSKRARTVYPQVSLFGR